MATTPTVRRDIPASARRLRRPAHQRAAGSRAVYDQDADLTARGARRVANPNAVHVRGLAPPDPARAARAAAPDPVRAQRPATPDPAYGRRPASPDPVHGRRPATPDPVRMRRPTYEVVARWLAITSLALVTLIAALIILT